MGNITSMTVLDCFIAKHRETLMKSSKTDDALIDRLMAVVDHFKFNVSSVTLDMLKGLSITYNDYHVRIDVDADNRRYEFKLGEATTGSALVVVHRVTAKYAHTISFSGAMHLMEPLVSALEWLISPMPGDTYDTDGARPASV